jgi:hypothetical protein
MKLNGGAGGLGVGAKSSEGAIEPSELEMANLSIDR